jgi:hypothetical protein
MCTYAYICTDYAYLYIYIYIYIYIYTYIHTDRQLDSLAAYLSKDIASVTFHVSCMHACDDEAINTQTLLHMNVYHHGAIHACTALAVFASHVSENLILTFIITHPNRLVYAGFNCLLCGQKMACLYPDRQTDRRIYTHTRIWLPEIWIMDVYNHECMHDACMINCMYSCSFTCYNYLLVVSVIIRWT